MEIKILGLEGIGAGELYSPPAVRMLEVERLVRSPVTARRHGVMLVSIRSPVLSPKRASMNWISDV